MTRPRRGRERNTAISAAQGSPCLSERCLYVTGGTTRVFTRAGVAPARQETPGREWMPGPFPLIRTGESPSRHLSLADPRLGRGPIRRRGPAAERLCPTPLDKVEARPDLHQLRHRRPGRCRPIRRSSDAAPLWAANPVRADAPAVTERWADIVTWRNWPERAARRLVRSGGHDRLARRLPMPRDSRHRGQSWVLITPAGPAPGARRGDGAVRGNGGYPARPGRDGRGGIGVAIEIGQRFGLSQQPPAPPPGPAKPRSRLPPGRYAGPHQATSAHRAP
jgi:hypothetical protein